MKKIPIISLLILLIASNAYSGPVITSGASSGSGSGGGWQTPKSITNPTASDDYIIDYVSSASTLSGMHGICVGGTSVTISLQQCDDDGLSNCADLVADAAITCGTKKDFTIADSSIAADKTLKLLVGTVTGSVTYVTVTPYGTTP